MDFLTVFSMFLSFIMSVYLFFHSYMEGIRICNEEGKVSGSTLIFTMNSALVFAIVANSLYAKL
ncbi:hypothetical protein LCL95_16790 [Bacillus timonensis]|nr:hypothetical protein [Bacillus timonensis]